VPGCKTDVKDAQWIAGYPLGAYCGTDWYAPASSRRATSATCRVLPGPMTRHRTNFVQQRATLSNRVQKVLEGANIKLASVVSDVMGVSGRAMLTTIASGNGDPDLLAELARGRLRTKREALAQALSGRVRPHHRFLLTELLAQIDAVEETIARFDAAIARACAANDEEAVVELLDTIPDIARGTAELLVAEIGTDMGKFLTPGHLAAWAGVAPGNHERAGRRRSGRTRKGNPGCAPPWSPPRSPPRAPNAPT